MTGRSKRVVDRVENALELLLGGPLSTPYSAPYRVVRQQRTYAIRHYGEEGAFEPGSRPPVLFIPPLMVTSEVFDIDPAISGVQALMNQGIDVWLTDFGAYVADHFPRYSRPLFLRFEERLETTATYKHVKTKLKEQGFDPAQCGGDVLFLRDDRYAELEVLGQIQRGDIRL